MEGEISNEWLKISNEWQKKNNDQWKERFRMNDKKELINGRRDFE